MNDKTKKLVDRMNKNLVGLAQTQSTVAIGNAVLAIIERGESVTVDVIIAHLRRETEHTPGLLTQAQNEAAEKALLAAQTKSQRQ